MLAINGVPALAYGVGTAWFRDKTPGQAANPELIRALKMALKAGFRHLDLAEMYGTDDEVAVALGEACIPRDELFITSKLLKSFAELDDGGVKQATQNIIKKLGSVYLDLMLLHAPFLPAGEGLEKAWRAMEELVDLGLVRALGVSNFRIEDIEQLLSFARIKPVINQVEFHPYLQQTELHQLCRSHGIAMGGYGGLMPLTHKCGGPVDPVLEQISAARGLTSAQVLLMWTLKKGAVAVTTGSQERRITDSLAAAAALAGQGKAEAQPPPPPPLLQVLSDEDVARIDEAGGQLAYRKYWQQEFGGELDWKRPAHSLT